MPSWSAELRAGRAKKLCEGRNQLFTVQAHIPGRFPFGYSLTEELAILPQYI